jgi:glycosyltransferase involved in cell wall biosynthesis
MMPAPKITVLMPVYNVAGYVGEAIESILNQTFTDFELLIIDDGSTDATYEKAGSFADPRIRLIRNESNIGLANTLNKGIESARGEYIARMDGDDISLPQRLEKQLVILEQHPKTDICGAGYRFFGSKNYEVIYPCTHDAIRVGLIFGCCMIIPLMRRESLIKHNLRYEQKFFPAEDYRFWIRCIGQLTMHNLQEVLFLYRAHPAQVSETMHNQSEMAAGIANSYFRSLFPSLTQDASDAFFRNFMRHIMDNPCDIEQYEQWKQQLIEVNKASRNLPERALSLELDRQISVKVRNFITSKWYSQHYSLSRYIKLYPTGLLSHIPLAFHIKLFIKSMLNTRL